MNEQSINQQYIQISLLIIQKRLKEALAQLESYLWSCTEWNLRNRFEQVQTSYSYMLQYMQQGMKDSERKRLYLKLQVETLEIADQVHLLLLDNCSSHYYHEYRRSRTKEMESCSISPLMHILESFNDDLAVGNLISQSKRDEALERHENTQKRLFLQTWTNSAWTTQDEAEAQELIQSEQLPTNDLCLFTSALTLSLMECFDLRKLMWLIDAYQHTHVQVSQRALVGLVFTLHLYANRTLLYPEIEARIELLNDTYPLAEELFCLQQQLVLCQETEKINKKMQEEILPEMIKNVSSMRNMRFGLDEQDEDKNDQNPDWANLFEQPGLGDKLREMNELQQEGADVYMSTFSALKAYPFFNELHNWLYPFDQQQSSILKQLKEQNKKSSIMDLLMQSGFFCNSDKYSLFFLMQSFPQAQRDSVFSQLTDQQMEDFAEQSKAETLKKYSERPATISNQYLHDLYRFFKLNRRRSEFKDPFKEKIQLYQLPVCKQIMRVADQQLQLANFHLKKGHWKEALEIYREAASINSPLTATSEFYQQTGYVLQKLNQYGEAIHAYQKADTIKPDNLWTNRHLATCYRMLGEFDRATEYYRKAAAAAPENKSILFYMAQCLAELQQYDEALNNFFKLDFLEDNSLKAWRGIGWCSFVTGKLEQAIKHYDKIIAKKPMPADYLNAGHAHWVSGNISNAISLYTQAAQWTGSRNAFVEAFQQDKEVLVKQGIAEEEIPLMLDIIE